VSVTDKNYLFSQGLIDAIIRSRK